MPPRLNSWLQTIEEPTPGAYQRREQKAVGQPVIA